MTTNEPTVQLRKGIIETAVLKLIEAKPLYGYEIIIRLEEYGFDIVQGTLYPLLSRMHKEGYVEYEWQESTQGPPRKYYKLTKSGKSYLQGMSTEWRQIRASMDRLFT